MIAPIMDSSVDSPSTMGTDSYVLDFGNPKRLEINDSKRPVAIAVTQHQADKDDMNDHSSETRLNEDNLIGEDEPVILTPKQNNVNHPPPIVSVTGSGDLGTTISDKPQAIVLRGTTHDDIPNDADIAWSLNDESPGFRQVHYHLFESISTWYQQDGANQHSFYMKWHKAKFAGLQANTKWERVAKILNMSYLKDYIIFMNECPHVRE
jgi:hypothetical protein